MKKDSSESRFEEMRELFDKIAEANAKETLTELTNDIWNHNSIEETSGTYTTNWYFPSHIRDQLFKNNTAEYIDTFTLKLQNFESVEPPLIKGMDVLKGLQEQKKEDNLTLYRAIRFPTAKRIWETINEKGLCTNNYEQERILELYQDKNYQETRERIKKDKRFWSQPQERVVDGLPVFGLVNDAIQIHSGYRNIYDTTLLITAHIPKELFTNNILELHTNPAITTNYTDESSDRRIMPQQLIKKNGNITIDYQAMRASGIDVYEMYLKGLPEGKMATEELGIALDFHYLSIRKVDEKQKQELRKNYKTLKQNEHFLHGFFGEQAMYGRNTSKYVPMLCYKVINNE